MAIDYVIDKPVQTWYRSIRKQCCCRWCHVKTTCSLAGLKAIHSTLELKQHSSIITTTKKGGQARQQRPDKGHNQNTIWKVVSISKQYQLAPYLRSMDMDTGHGYNTTLKWRQVNFKNMRI